MFAHLLLSRDRKGAVSAPTLAASLAIAPLLFGATAKVICTLGPATTAYKNTDDQRPSPDSMQLVGRVNTAAKTICNNNCPSVAFFRNVNAANAMFLAEGDQPRLVYSPQFFSMVHESYGDAGIIAIIAHEFGHALDDAMGASWIQSSWGAELRADAWGGCTLAKIDLTAGDMENALNALAKFPSPAHPAWSVRLPAIRTGYMQCGGAPAKFSQGKSGKGK